MLEAELRLRVASVETGARGTRFFTFEAVNGSPLPSVTPGAHVSLKLAEGLARQYSIINWGDAPSFYKVGVKLVEGGRGGSAFMHDQLLAGAELTAALPRNNFPLVEDAGETILIAGGIGITPIWSMATRLEALGRKWRLFYASRTEEDALFLDELKGNEAVELHFDDVAGGVPIDVAKLVASAPADAHLYCCGPAPMLDAFEAAAASLNPENVHLEHFAPRAGLGEAVGGYSIELVRSGKELFVPAGQTILEVLLQDGFDVPNSCREGVCGACETRVIAGDPDHRDAVLTSRERAANKVMMICCSGSKGPKLTLDL